MLQVHPNKNHISIVISPLNILMDNQVIIWKQKNIRCVALHSQAARDLPGINLSDYTLILLGPELALSSDFRGKIKSIKNDVCLVTFDEAEVRIEKYFDEALMAGINSVRLIHGKGTGRVMECWDL